MSIHDSQLEPGMDSRLRAHSIDLSLELERQLDNESLPPSSPRTDRPQSLDPQVLSTIIINLRTSLAEVQNERDALSAALAESQRKEEAAEAELKTVSERQAAIEAELEASKQKNQDDAETLAMLRSKVEESRRGLMRLQTENRRMSQTPLDLSRAGLPSFGGPGSSKRASFTPLTGSSVARMQAHRRISSVSDSTLHWAPESSNADTMSTSPNSQVITLPDLSSNPAPPPLSSRRFSGLFGRAAPIDPLDLSAAKPATSAEVESLRQEVRTLKAALEETRSELTESNEAKEASETCVKALREFIAENNVGPDAHASAAGRTSNDGGSRASISSSGAGGGANGSLWGFKLWSTGSGAGTPVHGSEPSMSPSSERNVVPLPKSQSQPPMHSQGEPLTKKLGGFFGNRMSGGGAAAPVVPRPMNGVQEPMYNGSDTSSADESVPVSPILEHPPTNISVGVRSAGSGLDEIAGSPDQKTMGVGRTVEVAL